MKQSFTTLQISYPRAAILQVTLNRPTVMNAINSEMMVELHQLWTDLHVPLDKQIRCIVLTGSGQKAFCAGADLKERYQLDVATWQAQHAVLQKAMLAMVDCPLPIIAAVNGIAFGGGLELALAADFIYAADTAIFAQSETKLGIMPGAMGTQHLPRACGIRRAKELAYTAQPFSAEQAYQWGLVNQLCPADKLLAEVLQVAQTIADNAPFAVRQAKKAMNFSQHSDIKSGYLCEVEAYNRLLPTQDREEGIRAFNEKRRPNFRGN
jgi:enoyl-CoA hydratase/carnithine racemase